MEQAAEGQQKVRGVRGRPRKEVAALEKPKDSAAQDLANRIWAGQSVDLPYKERAARIRRGLEAQGFDPDSVVIGG